VSTYDLSSLAPSDAEVALRSFPRRFREVLRPIGDDEAVDAVASQRGPDGSSALDLVDALVSRWEVQRAALHQALVADAPVVPREAVDLSVPVPGTGGPARVDAALTSLGREAGALADAVGAAPSSGWARTATTGAGVTTSALDVVREAVRAGRDTLDAVQRALAAVRPR
jgi:hypothetical protein